MHTNKDEKKKRLLQLPSDQQFLLSLTLVIEGSIINSID